MLGVLGFRPPDLGFRLLHKMYKTYGIIVVGKHLGFRFRAKGLRLRVLGGVGCRPLGFGITCTREMWS